MASFDQMKDSIRLLLAETKAKPLITESANKTYDQLGQSMTKEKLSFETAAAKLGLKTQESQPFIKSDYVEDVGEGELITAAAAQMKRDEISKPMEIRKGFLIFRVSEIQPFDQEKFKKEKEDFTKKALSDKKNVYTENWLKDIEKNAELKIDLKDYDKYYK